MNPGLGEEAGSTARAAITAMASTPTVLAVILLAALFAGLIYYSVNRERNQAHDVQMAVIERCFPVALMEAYQKLEVGDVSKFGDSKLPGPN